MKIARRKWRLAHPENERLMRQRAHHQHDYGEPYANKQKRLEAQEFRCANSGCRTTDPGPQGWHTDHDHETEKVRGELCGGCNKALGFIQDNIAKAEGLAAYLRHYN